MPAPHNAPQVEASRIGRVDFDATVAPAVQGPEQNQSYMVNVVPISNRSGFAGMVGNLLKMPRGRAAALVLSTFILTACGANSKGGASAESTSPAANLSSLSASEQQVSPTTTEAGDPTDTSGTPSDGTTSPEAPSTDTTSDSPAPVETSSTPEKTFGGITKADLEASVASRDVIAEKERKYPGLKDVISRLPETFGSMAGWVQPTQMERYQKVYAKYLDGYNAQYAAGNIQAPLTYPSETGRFAPGEVASAIGTVHNSYITDFFLPFQDGAPTTQERKDVINMVEASHMDTDTQTSWVTMFDQLSALGTGANYRAGQEVTTVTVVAVTTIGEQSLIAELTEIPGGKVPTTGEDGPDATLTIRTSVQVPLSAWDANDRRIKHAYAFPEIAELWHSTF